MRRYTAGIHGPLPRGPALEPSREPGARPPGHAAARDRGIGLRAALPVWAYVALNSFGGPAGQIAVMHAVLVDGRRWISEQRFLHALNYCMLLPGPEAHQLSVYIGWLLHGVRGGLLAGLLFVLPGFVSVLALSLLYALHQDTALVQAVFDGLKPAVLAIVVAAVLRVGRRAIRHRLHVAVTAGSWAAIALLGVPFPVVVLGAGLVGLAAARVPGVAVGPAHGSREGVRPAGEATAPGRPAAGTGAILDDADEGLPRPPLRRTALVAAAGLLLWLGPVAALALLLGPSHVFATEALFFSGAAVVTFGGAYAVLTYVAQQVVDVLGWLTPGEMLDGLAMAETTPGPLIMVVEFVGFLAAFRNPGPLDPVVAGCLGAILVTWVTFVPSFLWIFVGAPYAEAVRRSPRVSAALSTITAAVVGAILNLAVWFGLHALFGEVATVTAGPLSVAVPRPETLDPAALVIAGGAAFLVFRRRWPMLAVLAVAALAGLAWSPVRPA